MAGPALIKLGLIPVAAHLFVFYFAIISAITPPVCAAVYAATAIARSNRLPTGWLAVRMGLAGFVAPFLFVYRPAVVLAGHPLDIVWSSLVSALAVMALAGGAIGYFGGRCRWFESVLLVAGALLLIMPGLVTDLMGIIVVGAIFILQKRGSAVSESAAPLAAAGG